MRARRAGHGRGSRRVARGVPAAGRQCQTKLLRSASSMRSSSRRPPASNRQSSTFSACSRIEAKFTPAPSQLAPSGYGRPGLTVLRAAGGWERASTSRRLLRLTGGGSGTRELHPAIGEPVTVGSGAHVSERDAGDPRFRRRGCGGAEQRRGQDCEPRQSALLVFNARVRDASAERSACSRRPRSARTRSAYCPDSSREAPL